ncbi:hypothetical protein E8E12_000506 [Didymella heteroderae]|uniref:Uncharacterized protein n=1 Tax=Didymella heteroderae TaxID=1769908 RepID=A0A9P4WFD4_9PLEO|nr:hypothetical protein E8E12_000506 [Didymella heteroderae]
MDSHVPLLAQLDDSQLDEQVCLTFNALRQRLFAKNTTIFSMQQNCGREHLGLTHQIRALKQELAAERRKNEKLRATREDINSRVPWSEQVCNQRCRSDTRADTTEATENEFESVENGCGLDQRKRAKRSRRKETSLEASEK